MKKATLFYSFIFICLQLSANDIVAIFGYPKDLKLVPRTDQINDSQTPKIPDGDHYYNLKTMTSSDDNITYKRSIIIIRFFDRTANRFLKLRELGNGATIKITANEITKSLTVSNDQLGMNDWVIYFSDHNDFFNLNSYDPIEFIVELTNPNYSPNIFSLSTKYINKWSPYHSLGENLKGFWLPAFQFSSNLRSTEAGIPFASQPIGIAWGRKRNYQNQFYLGFSLMANWLVYTQPESSGIASSNSFNVSSLTAGFLLDIGDVFSIGYAYGFNFKSSGPEPGNMLVIGFGSKAISFLKKSKSPKNNDPYSLALLKPN